MKCEKCGKEHEGSYGSGRFCSRSCANARCLSEEARSSISSKLKEIPDKYCSTCGVLLSRQGQHAHTTGLCRKCESKKRKGSGKYGVSSTHWSLYISAKRSLIKDEAINLLGGKCQKCGYNKRIGLDFHHKDPSQKKFNLSTNGWTKSRESVLEEVKKCLLLCSNCHRELHEKLRQNKTLEEFMVD